MRYVITALVSAIATLAVVLPIEAGHTSDVVRHTTISSYNNGFNDACTAAHRAVC